MSARRPLVIGEVLLFSAAVVGCGGAVEEDPKQAGAVGSACAPDDGERPGSAWSAAGLKCNGKDQLVTCGTGWTWTIHYPGPSESCMCSDGEGLRDATCAITAGFVGVHRSRPLRLRAPPG